MKSLNGLIWSAHGQHLVAARSGIKKGPADGCGAALPGPPTILVGSAEYRFDSRKAVKTN